MPDTQTLASAVAPVLLERTVSLASREAIDEQARTVEVAFSSETEYERWYGIEVLDHAAGSVMLDRLNDRAAVLIDHDRSQHVGVIERAWVDPDRRGRAIVRFGRSANANEKFADVLDGVLVHVSVSYAVHDEVSERRDGVEVRRAILWEPYEISFVSVPADHTVGVGRSASRGRDPARVTEGSRAMSLTADSRGRDPARVTEGSRAMSLTADTSPDAPAVAPAADVRIIVDQAREQETARVRAIVATGRQFDLADHADRFVADGKSLAEFQRHALDEIAKRQAAGVASTRDIGLTDRETRDYSVMRLVRALVDGDWSKAGFERACHEAAVQKGVVPKEGGIMVPWDVQMRSRLPVSRETRGIMERQMSVSPATAGGHLIQTDVLAASYIEILRARARVLQLGARLLPGLQGNVSIPRQTGATAAFWLASDTTAITAGAMTLGLLSLTPRNVGAMVPITRQLMMQSSLDVEALVMDDIAKQLALAIDLAALHGTGAGGQPTGLSGTAGIGSVTGTSLNWAGIVELETDVAAANADVADMAYLTTPAVRGLLKGRERTGSTIGNYVWGGTTMDPNLNGYRAEVSTQVTAANMFMGDWSQLLIGEWGQLELVASQHVNFPAALTHVRGIVTIDVGVRHAGAFSLATGIT